ncbi:histidine--tRNA ligase [bacterium E08(2017)]|nr:histidine--tRNA ligase [bacterium E08(2017)]
MASSSTYQAPRGMRDFYPEDMDRRNFIFNAWTEAAREFGFSQYDASVVESLDLLKRKSGEEIVNQIYDFEDKSGRQLALRPEMTPTLARMIAAKQGGLVFPVKWFTIAQCFRYERMTKGRKREHYQWNLDVIGSESVSAEAELIACASSALSKLGLDSNAVRIKFSSRALLSELLESIGIPAEHHEPSFLALDKRGKIDDTEITILLEESGVDTGTIDQVFSLLNIKSIDDAANKLSSSPALDSIENFLSILKAYSLLDAVDFDISVVRGLTYYTGIVFEAFDAAGKFRAIFGGGRYDNLLSDVGGKPASGVGLGFGDVVIDEVLNELNIEISTSDNSITVGYMEDSQRHSAVKTASMLRQSGNNVELALAAEKPKNFFKRADKSGFGKALYIGPDDIENGSARLKTLANGEEELIPIP